MVRYLSLLSFTQQGIEAVNQSPKRAAAFRSQVKAAGGKVIAMYWSLGSHDGCIIFEAPDDQTASKLLLGLAKGGNVRTQSLRVYDDKEFTALLD